MVCYILFLNPRFDARIAPFNLIIYDYRPEKNFAFVNKIADKVDFPFNPSTFTKSFFRD